MADSNTKSNQKSSESQKIEDKRNAAQTDEACSGTVRNIVEIGTRVAGGVAAIIYLANQ